MADEDVGAVRAALDAGAVHVALTGRVQAVEDLAERRADQVLGQLGAVLAPVGFHHADFRLLLDDFQAALLPEAAQLRPELLGRGRRVQPAVGAAALQAHVTGRIGSHTARHQALGVGRAGGLDGRQLGGRDRTPLNLGAVVAGQLAQVRRHLQALGLLGRRAVVDLVAREHAVDGAAAGERQNKGRAGQAGRRGAKRSNREKGRHAGDLRGTKAPGEAGAAAH
mmetsp:Transcript_21382/g.82851  ORF Transcript_21382/g.82851 Transcript_21382/m.82851 type:complete len:224 (-) Transcript_21382:841-1512(-)